MMRMGVGHRRPCCFMKASAKYGNKDKKHYFILHFGKTTSKESYSSIILQNIDLYIQYKGPNLNYQVSYEKLFPYLKLWKE